MPPISPLARTTARVRAQRAARHPYEQVVIENIEPSVDGGKHPVKAIVGETFTLEATVFRHGHDRLRAAVEWRAPGETTVRELPMTLVNSGLDRWRVELPLTTIGRHVVTVIGWTDHYASWVEELGKRVRARQPDVAAEIAEGLAIVERVAKTLRGADQREVQGLLDKLRAAAGDPARLMALAAGESALGLMARLGSREDEARYLPDLAIVVDRERARFGAWYELFIRSQTGEPGTSGTFRSAEGRLDEIRRLGFDVIYLAPIHPIGHANRKGPNNRVGAGPDDPGSPWAIGSEHGGHMAIEPALGTLEDFERFVGAVTARGMEVALDLAIQCSPDHPWATEHPEWFYRRPDGSIRYAENPPKKYEDIYPVNFDTEDWKALWEALREVVLFWVARGVKIFRVDNPHTKPIGFWAWLIASVQDSHPEVLFLAEAFTRPPMTRALAKRGFTQSYTYFTWRNTKRELTDYLTELTTETALYFRPNFFANTPDILPPVLQQGGRPAFKSRLVLAATLSPTYGIYSGFELCENAAIPGREEYLDSEKYQIKIRDWNAPGNINEFVVLVNQARRDNPALQRLANVTFLETDNEQVIAYAKAITDPANVLIVVVNLNPFSPQEATIQVPPAALGMSGDTFAVQDLLTGQRWVWGASNWVRLDPLTGEPAHILRVELAV